MATRYEVGDDGGSEKMPDLKLITDNERTKQPVIGSLCTLLQWNTAYPVTAFEARRNGRIFEIQGNRNPFIDDSSWATRIWGSQCLY